MRGFEPPSAGPGGGGGGGVQPHNGEVIFNTD